MLAEEIFASVGGTDIVGAFGLYKKVEKLEKEEYKDFLDSLYRVYGEKINGAAMDGEVPSGAWLDATSEILRTKQVLEKNGNAQLAFEILFLRLR